MHKPLIIGITGPFGSGKTTAAQFFEKKGLKKIILSSFLGDELINKGELVTRINLQDLGNKLRKKFGRAILAKKALERVKKEKLNKTVVDGLRNVGEIEYLRKNSNFILIGIVCDKKIRFERIRNKKGREKLNFALFEKLDYRDLGINGEDSGLQVAKCLALSDHFIESNEGYDEFFKDLESLFNKL